MSTKKRNRQIKSPDREAMVEAYVKSCASVNCDIIYLFCKEAGINDLPEIKAVSITFVSVLKRLRKRPERATNEKNMEDFVIGASILAAQALTYDCLAEALGIPGCTNGLENALFPWSSKSASPDSEKVVFSDCELSRTAARLNSFDIYSGS